MNEDDLKELQNIAKTIKRINGKIKLLALLERAKFEYDSNNFSDCEKIGHVKGGWQIEDCATTEIACDPGQEDSVDCKILFDLSTEEGCRKFIDYANKEEEVELSIKYGILCDLLYSNIFSFVYDRRGLTILYSLKSLISLIPAYPSIFDPRTIFINTVSIKSSP